MSFEERLKEFAADLASKGDKSIQELLYGHYPDLTEKEFAICRMIAYAAWESSQLYFYDVIIQNTAEKYKELFHNIDEVETVIKQLIEKGILKDKFTFVCFKRGGNLRCNCLHALERCFLYHVRQLDLKDEIESESFMIYSTLFGSSSSEYFGPAEPEDH
jgi:hypothetical protein